MKLYFNTDYDTELTLESDNVTRLIIEAVSLNKLLNQDSYIGFNNYLNHHCEECAGSVRTKSNTIIYIIREEGENDAYLIAKESSEGVKLSYITCDKEFLYNRIVKQISTEVL